MNQFAEATGDHQWIHVDPERAKKESPFGGPIAHGYLTLSLIPSLLPADHRDRAASGWASTTAPRRCASRRRCRSAAGCGPGRRWSRATPFDGGIAMNLGVTIEIEGGTKPAMVATVVYRRYL